MNWFESWFDTEYYHLLYKHRNHEEAKHFVELLLDFLHLNPGDTVVDIGCGKGRHSMVMAEKGMRVYGMDLSENSIASANIAKEARDLPDLNFVVHDMRKPYPVNQVNAVFNLFTSFGYFEDAKEDFLALQAMAKCLVSEGYVVQDYLNALPLISETHDGVMQSLTWSEMEGVRFGIEKWTDKKKIFKRITVLDSRGKSEDRVEPMVFTEEVKIYTADELIALHQDSGLEVVHIFGNYDLEGFDKELSPRIIVVSRKSPTLSE